MLLYTSADSCAQENLKCCHPTILIAHSVTAKGCLELLDDGKNNTVFSKREVGQWPIMLDKEPSVLSWLDVGGYSLLADMEKDIFYMSKVWANTIVTEQVRKLWQKWICDKTV